MVKHHPRPILLSALATLTLVLSGLLPAALPAAAAGIQLSRSTAAPGDNVAVTGSGFAANGSVVVQTDFNVQGSMKRYQSAVTAGGNGSFTASITVPAGTYPGTYRITARDFHRGTATADLTVEQVVPLTAGGSASSRTIGAGHGFFVRGTGFGSGETVSITATFPLFSGNSLTETKSATTDKNGAFPDVAMVVPANAKPGTVTVTGTGGTSKKKGTGNVTVVYRPSLALKPATAPPGGSVDIGGQGFIPGSKVTVSVSIPRTGGTTESFSKDGTPDAKGAFTVTLSLPSDVKPGDYHITAVDAANNLKAAATLKVSVHPVISLKPASTSPGGSTTVTGAGYGAGVSVTVSATFPLYGGGSKTVTATGHTSGSGTFSATLAVPGNAAAATVTVTAKGPNGQGSAKLQIGHVGAKITVSPASAIPGGSVTVTGSGYPGGDKVEVSVTLKLTNGSSQTVTVAATVNGKGQFTTRLQIPGAADGGTYTVVGKSTSSGRAPTGRLIIAKLAPSVVVVPTVAVPGTPVTVRGFGFAAGETVTISLDGQKVGTATANSAGQLSLRFTVPGSTSAGTSRVDLAGNTGRRASINLTVNRTISTHFYFASLYTGTGYHEYLTFVNETEIRARVGITYTRTNGTTLAKNFTMGAHSRFTEDVNADLGPKVSAGAVIDTDVPIVAERVVFHYGDGSDVPGTTTPANIWYFANGNTSRAYREYVAVENPNKSAIQIAAHFLPTHHAAFTITRNMPATSRTTIKVSQYVPKDAVGVIITSNSPIVANRTIFIKHGMNSKIGVTAPQRTWYFAAGPTDGAARHWIGVINPFNRRSYITLHAYGPGGSELGTVTGWLKPYARVGYLMNKVAHQTDVAIALTASQPIVAEQTTYIGNMHDASTDTFGVPAPAKSWQFANVSTTSGQGATLSLFNPNLAPIPIVVQYVTASGRAVQATYVVGPLQHQNIDVGSAVPNSQMGILVASNNAFVALNRIFFNNGRGAMTSIGVHG